jgi:DNA-binding MarR family transcriptional regulator
MCLRSIEYFGFKVLNYAPPKAKLFDMQSMDLPDHVLVALRRIIRATDLHSRKLGKKTGLTTPQLVIIKAVGDLKDPTVSDIAKAVSLSLATVTTILNRLERNGLVNRVRSSVDRRRVIVTLTEAGQTLKSSAPKPLQDSFVDRFSRLASWEQHSIVASLERVAAMMDADDLDAAPLLASGEDVV